jgi:hypothetical protein
MKFRFHQRLQLLVMALPLLVGASVSGCKGITDDLKEVTTAFRPDPAPTPQASLPPLQQPSLRTAEWLREMIEVIYALPLEKAYELTGDQSGLEPWFWSWANVMEQGASVEGVYHGLILSGAYQQLEKNDKNPVNIDVFKNFVNLLDIIQSELPERTEFETGFKSATTSAEWIAHYQSLFKSKNKYVLKRVLGGEVLKLASVAFSSPERQKGFLAFYLRFVGLTGKMHNDFGHIERNKKEALFHSQWYLKASRDQVTWELLNRIHRLLNS